ncbi:MAG TPA: hypothetical protein VET23_02690 [Chitinophagaceae bacterium]|nr:hypothetical protein [Chitinophagaceae bacterium]
MWLVLISPLFLQAQNFFQRPGTIQQFIGRMSYEQKARAYQNAPQYVKNVTFNYPVINYTFPTKKSISSNRILLKYSTVNFIKTSYKQQLSFFCRQEYNIEKYTGIPLRFRLGSLDYTNYLEQKPNSTQPQY